ncbi:hypothetical protein AAG906_030838 [Vitis piasezkii]
MTHSGRIAQLPHPTTKPFEGATSLEGVRREDDEVEITTTPKELIHIMMTNKATCIMFSNDDFPLEVGCSNHKTIRVYDNTKRKVLGQPWIHGAGAIPFSLHQKVKFIHDGQVIMTLEIEDFYKDFLAMSFDQHNSSFLLRLIIDTWCDYTRRRIDNVVFTDGEIKLQHLFHQLQLGDGTPGTSVSVVIALPSPDRASLLSLCFLEEVTTNGVVIKPAEMIDGVILHDEWRYEMDMMGMSQITIIVQPEPASPFDLFRVFTSEVTEEIQTIPILEFLKDDGSLFEDIVSHVEGASNLDMSGLHPSIVQHHLPILPHAKSIKQKLSTVGHSMLSFMDGFSGYNQILMALEDMEKTVFITE